jgi:hypothetical protein
MADANIATLLLVDLVRETWLSFSAKSAAEVREAEERAREQEG